jgi:hypothetical protein
MNALNTKLHAIRLYRAATVLISVALLAVSAPATLNAHGPATPLACQANFCGG